MRVFVLDTNRKPLDPCHPARARQLLREGKAAVFRRYPFAIILQKRTLEESIVHPHRVKIDPGSKITGLVALNESTGTIVWGAEIAHRGQQIHARMQNRAALRRSRRNRKTRYRQPRYLNRNPAKCIVCGQNARHGHTTCRHHSRKRPTTPTTPRWLPPSLESRVANVETWVKRLIRYVPVAAISMELVRFDLQKVVNPEIQGTEYQQGTLYGYELRQYLLEKCRHQCAYCGGASGDSVLEIEHITPKSRGGSDRVSNLAIACHTCNERKGNLTAAEFGHPEIAAEAKHPLRDAAAVNSTRWVLWHRLRMLGLPLETGSGGRTKYNRSRLGYPKAHWIDAACVGESGSAIRINASLSPLSIQAIGHGSRRMQNHNQFGFPKGRAKQRKKVYFGFQTGDIVLAAVPQGKEVRIYVGRILCRASGRFDIQTGKGRIPGISYRYCKQVHRKDGYSYAY